MEMGSALCFWVWCPTLGLGFWTKPLWNLGIGLSNGSLFPIWDSEEEQDSVIFGFDLSSLLLCYIFEWLARWWWMIAWQLLKADSWRLWRNLSDSRKRFLMHFPDSHFYPATIQYSNIFEWIKEDKSVTSIIIFLNKYQTDDHCNFN